MPLQALRLRRPGCRQAEKQGNPDDNESSD
jgi:hypothetical protein